EAITVQELANRMAERGVDVIKCLMKMDVIANMHQSIDGDTAELVVAEFGHTVKRVSESDVEIGLGGGEDVDQDMAPRAPVVTLMGHVDHGKTSLLDALRETDVVKGEAGGITQHIGAYQITNKDGGKITFIDTPGHKAFSAMRARGAGVTDIVVLCVAADDGIMPQTVEAIDHAKAAGVPIIVAINKIDKPDADPNRVRTQLLEHEMVLEAMGGDVLDVEVSATEGANLDKLEEAILLQAEILDLTANPGRAAEGTVLEAKLVHGRGPVATVLVGRGTVRTGDVFIAGAEQGRVRALISDRGESLEEAGPSVPVEVVGLGGVPEAGEPFTVVENESRAREVSEFRQNQARQAKNVLDPRSSLEEMFVAIQAGELKELPLLIKADVQGSVEAIKGILKDLPQDEVKVEILHDGAGGINESDVTLAAASKALIIGFNVRANPQARDLAERDGVDIRYYSVIYDVADDVKKLVVGLMAPIVTEDFLGNAEVREVFNVSKVGMVAGCMVTEGSVQRGARVRLLRDQIVIHEGSLSTLRRFKDDAREVREGMECGASFENYHDLKEGDVIECFNVRESA
ncbi:MAG: translation initiation factor IF-2, partial [Rhodospirillales bacterium]|nr:translation initiation factor IF-2 [Rhodospirillales bacterium]